MSPLSIVTGNPHKAKEIEAILGMKDVETLSVDAPEIQSFSLEEIVRAKAEFAQKTCGSPVVVEDVSLHIGTLGGFPGPFVKFWHKEVGYDRAVEIAEKMGNGAVLARCGVGYSDGVRFFYVEGQLSGTLVSPRGTSDFGFDRYFQPDGESRTFGEMTKEEKNSISHRKLGWEAMREKLKEEGIL